MRLPHLSLVLLSCLALHGPAKAENAPVPATASVPTPTVDPDAESARLDALLQSFVEAGKLNCVTGLVAKGGKVIYKKSFGWKDVDQRIPATVDDYYVLFSQTKAVTSVAFMTLVDQGLVSVDDPVAKFFPGIPDKVITQVYPDGTYETRPVKTPMTFAHLLSHTSGLGAGLVHDLRRAQKKPSEAPYGFGAPIPEPRPAGQHTGGGNPNSQFLREEMESLAQYPLGWDPGSRWEYHLSTNMLGYLVERISGRPLRDYVKEKVLLPLGMTETDWYYEPSALGRFVKPHRVENGKLVVGDTVYSEGTVRTPQTYAEGAIGLNGPISDYAKFCQMLLNGGELNGVRILKPDTVRLMTSLNRLPEGGSGDGFQFGLGFELHRKKKPAPCVSDSAFSWSGMFGTQYIIDPEHDLVALFYINMYGSEWLYPQFLEQAYRLAGAAPVAKPSSPSPAVVVIEKGGTGPYSAIATEDPLLPGMTLYRPADLAPFGENRRLPVLLWGNGACANTTQEHRNFLNELASHGYLVLGIGPLDQIETRDEKSRQPTQASQLTDALDWILAQDDLPKSVFHGKIDAAKIAAMGMSCGGLQAIEISGDPRITTSVICNSGVLPGPPRLKGMPALTKDALQRFHGPVLYLMGGPTDIAYANARDDFSRINHVPVIMTNLDVGHGGTYGQPHGGDYSRVALAWLDWQLKGDQTAARFFLDSKSGLHQDPKWTVELKNIPTL